MRVIVFLCCFVLSRATFLGTVPLVSGTQDSYDMSKFPTFPSLIACSATSSPQLRLRGGWNFPGKESFSKKEKEILKGLSTGLVYTQEDPGPWAEKVKSHLPVAALDIEPGSIRVSLPHGMDDETPEKPLHYIEFIWIMNEDGDVLDIHAFSPTDEAPIATFPISPPGGRSLAGKRIVPFAMCNLHGVWRGSALAVP